MDITHGSKGKPTDPEGIRESCWLSAEVRETRELLLHEQELTEREVKEHQLYLYNPVKDAALSCAIDADAPTTSDCPGCVGGDSSCCWISMSYAEHPALRKHFHNTVRFPQDSSRLSVKQL